MNNAMHLILRKRKLNHRQLKATHTSARTPNHGTDPSGLFDLVDLGNAAGAGAGVAASGLGLLSGLALSTLPGGALVGVPTVIASAYGIGVNSANLGASLLGYQPGLKGGLFNDIAEFLSPGNQNLQDVATVCDLGLGLGGGIAAGLVRTPNLRAGRFGPLIQGGGKFGGTFAGNGEKAVGNFAGVQAGSAAVNSAIPNPYEYFFGD
jgi:hypothetical protein